MSPILTDPAYPTPDDPVDVAVLSRLRDTFDNVHDGHVTDSDNNEKTISADLPYVVYHSTPGYPVNPRNAGRVRGRVVEFQITSVGASREQAKWAGQRAEDTLDGQPVLVAEKQQRIRRTNENPFVGRDTTWTRPGGRPLFLDVRRYTVRR